MQNSAGSAEKEMSIIEESMEYKLNALKETAVGVFQNLIQRDDAKEGDDIERRLFGAQPDEEAGGQYLATE